MTDYELQQAQELKENIEHIKECVEYFNPLTNGRFNGWGNKLSQTAEKALKYEKFPFTFKLTKKDKKTANCEIHIKGYFGGMALEVDKNFIDHCRAYFENELEKAKTQFAEFTTRSDTNEKAT